jgi:hypothetical protein
MVLVVISPWSVNCYGIIAACFIEPYGCDKIIYSYSRLHLHR